MWYRVASLCVTTIGLAGCVTFIVSYIRRSNGAWRDSEAGRFFVIANANLAALFLLVISNQILGPWPGRQVVAILLYTAYTAQSWWPLRLLLLANRESKRHKEGE